MRNFNRRSGAKIFRRACVCLLLLCGAVYVEEAAAQDASGRREQTSFGVEEAVRRPVPVPPDVLRGLGQDEKVLACLTENAGNAAVEIPAAWFAASAIDLNGDRRPDLVVKPENSCLYGANIAPFWVFRNTGRGYALVLRTDALNLQILPARTRGYRNIRARAASARQVFARLYRFDGESYRASRR